MLDGDISSIEFRKVLQEVEKYHQLKAGIRNQAKTKVRQITKGQWKEQSKEYFLRKIANSSDIQGVNAI